MIHKVMPLLGKLDYLLYRAPLLGKVGVRGKARVSGFLLYHTPILGGKHCKTVAELRDAWFGFLARVGIHPTIVEERETELLSQVHGVISLYNSGILSEMAGDADEALQHIVEDTLSLDLHGFRRSRGPQAPETM